MEKELTHKEVASSGGKKRWKGYTKEQRKVEMKKVWSKRKKLSTDGLDNEVAQ